MTVLPFPKKPLLSNYEMLVTETILTIGHDKYRVRRSVDPDHGGGFVMIYDASGATILVYSASVLADLTASMIVAFRAGFLRGRGLGREEAISIVPEAGQ